MSTALDATALIYAIERTARRDHERVNCETVHEYVRWLRETQREEIIIPAPAFSEFLAFYGDGDRMTQIAEVIKRGFRIVEMDFRAACLAAEIWVKLGGKDFRKRMASEFEISKQCVKTDIQIIATAVAHGASRIVTADTGVALAASREKLIVLTPEQCIQTVSQEAEEIKDAAKAEPKRTTGKTLLSMLEEPEPPQ